MTSPLFLAVIVATVYFGNAANENTCNSLKSCLDEANKCRQEARAGGPLTEKKKEKLIKKFHLNNCDDASVQKIVDTIEQTKIKSQKRQELVASCIGGDVQSFPGCPALPLPSAEKLTRHCKEKSGNSDAAVSKRAANKCEKGNCRKDFCGCPEAKMCHQCYEISPLHDEIHGLQLSLQLQLAKCSGNYTIQHDAPMPDEEDPIGHSLTSF